MKQSIYLTLGSNLNQERCYPLAVKMIAELGEIAAVSPVYETEPVGLEEGAGKFFNGAVLLLTELGPETDFSDEFPSEGNNGNASGQAKSDTAPAGSTTAIAALLSRLNRLWDLLDWIDRPFGWVDYDTRRVFGWLALVTVAAALAVFILL